MLINVTVVDDTVQRNGYILTVFKLHEVNYMTILKYFINNNYRSLSPGRIM